MRLLNLLGCFLSPVALGHLPLEHFLLEGLPVIVSDRSSPSRVRFAASRPGRLRADPKDALLTREKGEGGPWGARASG